MQCLWWTWFHVHSKCVSLSGKFVELLGDEFHGMGDLAGILHLLRSGQKVRKRVSFPRSTAGSISVTSLGSRRGKSPRSNLRFGQNRPKLRNTNVMRKNSVGGFQCLAEGFTVMEADMFTESMLNSFNDLDYAIYNTVIRNSNRISKLQVKDLADAAHVSTASVIRFCKKTGCKGFSEFKYRYCESQKLSAPQTLSSETQALRSFLTYSQSPDFLNAIESAFRYLQAATQVIFVGVGASGNLASFGARIFCNAGCFSLYINDPFLPIINIMTANPVVMAISFSGKTSQTMEMTQRFIECGSKVISITNTKDNPLAKISDVNIAYYVKDIPIENGFNMGTQMPVVFTVELLGKMLYEKKNADRTPE